MDSEFMELWEKLEGQQENTDDDTSSVSTNIENDKEIECDVEKCMEILNIHPHNDEPIEMKVRDKFGITAHIKINKRNSPVRDVDEQFQFATDMLNDKLDRPHPQFSELSQIKNTTGDTTGENQDTRIVCEATENGSSAEAMEITDNCSLYRYNWKTLPRLLCSATKEYEPTELYENFTKGCQWSPDGTCLMVPSEDYRVRVYELPRELYSGVIPEDYASSNILPALTIKEGGLIYDNCWYPFMNSWDPTTCCFLTTSKDSPVHLWDAFTGELRATYRAYNQVDEIEAAISVQFAGCGSQVWCGFKNTLRIFDTNRPTRQLTDIQFKHSFPNARGLVSCIRENPLMPGLVAFGTYSKCIGLYKDGPLCVFQTDSGVTQIEFSTCGTKLFSTSRRSNEFLCWDLRNPGVLLYSLQGRESDTNQRIQFSTTSDGSQVVSGGTDGKITVWELSEVTSDANELNPAYKIELSKDCINGTSLHRSLPILATSSGQRICDLETKNRDNSIRLWWIS